MSDVSRAGPPGVEVHEVSGRLEVVCAEGLALFVAEEGAVRIVLQAPCDANCPAEAQRLWFDPAGSGVTRDGPDDRLRETPQSEEVPANLRVGHARSEVRSVTFCVISVTAQG